MLLLKDETQPLNLEGYTAIVPSISVGNAAQLACDLLISTLQLRRVGNLWHPALIPIIGPSAFQHDPQNQAASGEVYVDETKKILIIQIRSPLIPQQLCDFNGKLVTILSQCSKVIILTSSYGYEKHTVEANFFEYRANDQFKQEYSDKLGNLSWTEFTGDVVHGAGNANRLYRVLSAANIPTLLLFKYVLEGDNSQDASHMVRELDELCEPELQMKTNDALRLIVPTSWKLLFGNDVTELIF